MSAFAAFGNLIAALSDIPDAKHFGAVCLNMQPGYLTISKADAPALEAKPWYRFHVHFHCLWTALARLDLQRLFDTLQSKRPST